MWSLAITAGLAALWFGAAYGLMLHGARHSLTIVWWLRWLYHRPPFCVELSHKRMCGIQLKEPHNHRPRMYRLDGRWWALVRPVPIKDAWYVAPAGWVASLANHERHLVLRLIVALRATAEWLGAITGRRMPV